MIVANPPYIDKDDTDIDQEVLLFEPKVALFSEDHGFADALRILALAPTLLVKGGWLYMEHGWQQSARLVNEARLLGYKQVISKRDIQGHDRFLVCQVA